MKSYLILSVAHRKYKNDVVSLIYISISLVGKKQYVCLDNVVKISVSNLFIIDCKEMHSKVGKCNLIQTNVDAKFGN